MPLRTPAFVFSCAVASLLAGGCLDRVEDHRNNEPPGPTEPEPPPPNPYPDCVPREADSKLAFEVTNDWPGNQGAPHGQELKLDCQVAVASPKEVVLTCSDATITDGLFAIDFDVVPNGFEHGLQVGEALALVYDLIPGGPHQEPTLWLTLHAAGDNSVALVLGDYPKLFPEDEPSVDGLAFAIDRTVCPDPCPDGDVGCMGELRTAISLDPSAPSVVDGTNRTVTIGQQQLHVFAVDAREYNCLNCNSDLVVAIARAGGSF